MGMYDGQMSLFEDNEQDRTDFYLHFYIDEEDNYTIDILDNEQILYGKVVGDSLEDVFHHALHYADPIICSGVFKNNLEWSETHKVG